jgi:hypothetical protein
MRGHGYGGHEHSSRRVYSKQLNVWKCGCMKMGRVMQMCENG